MVIKGTLGERAFFTFVGLLGKWALGLYYSTVRIVNDPESLRLLNRAPQPAGIFCCWHAHVLSVMWHHRRTRSAVLISQSREGEYAARIAEALGYRAVRGSETRGAASGLKEMLRVALADQHTFAIMPDGSRGPRHCVKPGALALAQKSGHPLVPMAIGLSHYWELKTWDRFRIPKPFSRGRHFFGEPLRVPANADEAELRRLALELQARINALEEGADKAAAGRWSAECRMQNAELQRATGEGRAGKGN